MQTQRIVTRGRVSKGGGASCWSVDKETRVFDGQTMRFDLSSTRGVRAPLVFFRVEDAGVNLTMGVVPFDKGRRPRSDLSRYGECDNKRCIYARRFQRKIS